MFRGAENFKLHPPCDSAFCERRRNGGGNACEITYFFDRSAADIVKKIHDTLLFLSNSDTVGNFIIQSKHSDGGVTDIANGIHIAEKNAFFNEFVGSFAICRKPQCFKDGITLDIALF